MDDNYEYTARKKELAAKYVDKMNKHENEIKRSLTSEQYDFFKSYGLFVNTSIYKDLLTALKDPNTIPSEYVSEKMGWLFDAAISSRGKDVIMYFADRLQEYAYSDSYGRRSFRVRNNGAYALKLSNIIRQYGSTYMCIIDEPLENILNGELPEEVQAYVDGREHVLRGCGYSGWQVAYALDQNNVKVEDAVRRIIMEENGSGMMTGELICGVLLSHRNDFHELLGKLLVAARLQEGLRQSICEFADCGTKAGFLAILRVIDENNLIRFSSVKRAVGTWLGILTDDTRDIERFSEKSVKIIIDCIESVATRKEYIASEDAMKIYIALWSYGLDDVEEAISKITCIANNGSKHQLLVAGYFVKNLDLPQLSSQIAKTVLKLHYDKEDVVAVWLPCIMPDRFSALFNATDKNMAFRHYTWFDSKDEIQDCYALVKKLYLGFSGKAKTFSPCIFPWYEAKLAKSDFVEILCGLAAIEKNDDRIDEACGFINECNSVQRHMYFSMLLGAPKTNIQRKTVLEGLAGKDKATRETAYGIVLSLCLSSDEYRLIEEYLRFKGSDIRKNVMALLLRQGDSELNVCISRLIWSDKEEVRLGGLDMLLQLKKDAKRNTIVDSFSDILSERAKLDNISSKEKILLDALAPNVAKKNTDRTVLFSAEDKYNPSEFDADYIELCANTFSAYFPDSQLPELIQGKKGDYDVFRKIKASVTGDAVCKSAVEAAADLDSLSRFIEKHKTDSFIDYVGETTLLCNARYLYRFNGSKKEIAFKELWKEWADKNSMTSERIVRAIVLQYAQKSKARYSKPFVDSIRTVFGEGFEYGKKLKYSNIIKMLLEYMVDNLPKYELSKLAFALMVWFVRCVPNDGEIIRMQVQNSLSKENEDMHLLDCKQFVLICGWFMCKNDENLKSTFPLAVASSEKYIATCKKVFPNNRIRFNHLGYYFADMDDELFAPMYGSTYLEGRNILGIGAEEYLFAAYRGIITRAQLFCYLLDPDNICQSVDVVTSVASSYYEKGKQVSSRNIFSNIQRANAVREFLASDDEPNEEDMKLIKFVADVYDDVIPVILASELARGDSPAEYTKAVFDISRIYGAKYFAEILSAMGNDTFERNAYWGLRSASDRRESLSYLLSVCIPASADNAKTLKSALAEKKIQTKRLIEAALFSPEWIPLVGEYIGIDSFESVCYYFMAHMKEEFDDKRKAMIARYTPLSDEELNLGAFDVNWFRSAYNSTDENTFELIYDAAKYISDGAKHSRARKYSDAALGKLDVVQTENAISEKRNKDLLMAYALIPLSGEDDICRRYLYIQKFLKESKQFGSQRVASEGKAVETALTNLAINAGYSDTMRLTLRMETKIIDDSRNLLEEHVIDDVSFNITFDENGKATLVCVKDGKQLKSVPTRLKKDENVLALKNTVKSLTEQYRRTRLMLERAMEDSTVFTFGELSALSVHPVVYPMLKNIVFISDDTVGFIAKGGLTDFEGTVHSVENDAGVRIAHPFDLYGRGFWRNYQRYIFENNIVQPFRQVFRELYIKTPEEMGLFHSLRYAGNQIQPAKTVGVLKSRRWIADIEDGLQKVYYKENIVARIYALADWFSPADIEAPTLEWVCFNDRRTGKEIRIGDIPDIVFSEIMRDVDLAVSVAHVGGVDPETSHSTMEMRAAILSFVLPMFRIENVKIEGRHAIINGKLAEYSVHLGSGVVHQLGGTMIPVLPVHSQHRGRIFLPFVDDDPKTAEIISKVLLFAEDSKIKDPMILSAISK